MKRISLAVVIIILMGCKENFIPPADFGFTLKYYNVNTVSSIDSTFSRNYRDSTKVVTIVFSSDEKSKIYNKLRSIKYETYPEDYDEECDGYIIPAPYFELIVKENGNVKRISYFVKCVENNDLKTKRLLEVLNYIIMITEKKDIIKSLEDSNILVL